MEYSVECETCGAVLRADSTVCDVCSAGKGNDPPEPVYAPPDLEEPAPPAGRRGWLREIPGFRTDSLLERALAIIGYLIILALLLSAISGNWLAFILGLDLLAIAFIAANSWGLRSRLPLFGSSNVFKAAGGWLGLGLIGVFAFWVGVPQSLALPAAQPSSSAAASNPTEVKPGAQPTTAAKAVPSNAILAALQAEIERNRKVATPTPVNPSDSKWIVGNTGGDGVALRRTPTMNDRLSVWQDGTQMVVVGDDKQGDGRLWKNVRDPAGNVGWVPAEYLLQPRIVPSPAPSEGNIQAALADVRAVTDRMNRAMGIRFFEGTEITQGGAQLAVTVSDAWYELPVHWKERTVEMLADNYAAIAASRGLRGAPGEANYPRTTFYDTYGKELGYRSAAEVRIYR